MIQVWRRRRVDRRTRSRAGAATVELAFCLVPMVVLLAATTDVCQMMFLRQEATIVALETARLRARPGVSDTQAIDRGKAMLAEREIAGGSVQIAFFPTSEPYRDFQVVISVPCRQNLAFGLFGADDTIMVQRSGTQEFLMHTK